MLEHRRIPIPLKPKFRYLKRREHLTTVIAVQCRDGVVLCSDGQETSEYVADLGTKEIVSKIRPVSYNDENDRYCLLGCAGIRAYSNQFRERVGEAFFKREGGSYFKALDSATRNYAKYVTSRGREIGFSFSEDLGNFTSAIFVGYEPKDDKTRVYVLAPPKPPDLLSAYPHRVAIGTGGLYASLLFNIAELLMAKIELAWNNLSMTLVAQFCYMVLGRVMNYDTYSGMGTQFYEVKKTGYEWLTNERHFPGHGTDEKYRLPIFLRTLLSEVPMDRLLGLVQKYNLAGDLSGAIGDLLSER